MRLPAQPPAKKKKKSEKAILREQWREELPTLTMGKSGVGEDPLASVTPAPGGCVKVVAWNVNGLRALLRKGAALQAYVDAEKPDVFCLAETKVSDDWVETVRPRPPSPPPPTHTGRVPLSLTRWRPLGPRQEGKALLPGYHAWWNCADKKGARRCAAVCPLAASLTHSARGRQGTRAPPCSPRSSP